MPGIRSALATLCVLALFACGAERPDASGDAPPSGDGPGPGAQAPGADGGPGLPVAVLVARVDERDADGGLALLDDLAPASAVRAEPLPNAHDPSLTDTLRTLAWDGLELRLYRVTSSGQDLVQELVVTGGGHDTGLGFGVGATRAEVRAALGEPGRTDDGRWSWDLYDDDDDPTPTALTVAFGPDDRVTEIRWGFYMG